MYTVRARRPGLTQKVLQDSTLLHTPMQSLRVTCILVYCCMCEAVYGPPVENALAYAVSYARLARFATHAW